MTQVSRNFETRYANRRRKIIKQIPGEAALFSAAPEQHCSRDQYFPFRQSSDFFYLTGLEEPESVLLLLGNTRGPRSVLFMRDSDPLREKWEGPRLGLKRAKKKFKIDEVRHISQLASDLPELLIQATTLNYAWGSHPTVDSIVGKLLQSEVGPRLELPNALRDARLLTSEMRFVKDRPEIQSIQHAVDITTHSIFKLSRNLRSVVSEQHAARLLESNFSELGAKGTAFPTIVAAGKHATCLHHQPTAQPLWKRELVLIDCGALFHGYAGDITRTLPVSGQFSGPQAEVYDVVESALKAATEKSVPGATLDEVHQACVRTLTRGLVDLGLLEGHIGQLVAQKKYQKFFMHRTSHWLGLDVHDVAPITHEATKTRVPPGSRPLQPGNVFTIEPGLYFDPKDRDIPKQYRGIGIRLEDDVLITDKGNSVLSAKLPTAREEIEEMMK